VQDARHEALRKRLDEPTLTLIQRGQLPQQAFHLVGAALFGPVERSSGTLFYAHMIQHELLMLVAAPLLVIGAPLATWSWSLPVAARRRAGRVTRSIGHSRAWRALASPVGAWAAHAIAVCGWHLPAAFGAALSSVPVHDLQHASFLATALFFWWSLLRPHATRRDDGVAVLLLFTTMLYTGALGALLAFSATPWYADYPGHGTLSALEDQQLGGLIMWLPGGVVYAAAALALLARCIGGARPRAPRADLAGASPSPARR
jgi:putative membrane protein